MPTHDFHAFWTFLPEATQALDQIGVFIRNPTSPHAQPASGQRLPS
ncbi:MAG: hypothetical protein ACRDRJ_03825 [Streptosporangiaceae bacterium]